MPVNLYLKDLPETLVARLRRRAKRNHRSLQGELMAILEAAASEPVVLQAGTTAAHGSANSTRHGNGLLERLLAIAGDRGVDASKRLSREHAHNRQRPRRSVP